MRIRNYPACLGVLIIASIAVVGCATKKHVREAIAPVQDQANKTQAQVNALQKQTDENKQNIGDLDRQVATADEKAVEAGKRAQEAADAAAKAYSAASDAAQRADAANTAAQQARQKLDTSLQNLDNYKLVTTQPVYFAVNRSTLTKEEQAKLDDAVQKLGSMKMYIVEVEGYADRSGNAVYNRELSRKRADAVVHYLSVEHNVPLRSIRELGAGSDFPNADNKTRAARKENRRVDVKIYQLDVDGSAPTGAESSLNTAKPSNE